MVEFVRVLDHMEVLADDGALCPGVNEGLAVGPYKMLACVHICVGVGVIGLNCEDM